jgi:hypothetical protein
VPETVSAQPASHPERLPAADDRYEYRRPLLVHFLVKPSFRCARALLHSIAADSLGLLLPSEPEPGAILFLRLHGRRRGGTLMQLVKVRAAQQRPDGSYLIDCILAPPLNADDLALAVQLDH